MLLVIVRIHTLTHSQSPYSLRIQCLRAIDKLSNCFFWFKNSRTFTSLAFICDCNDSIDLTEHRIARQHVFTAFVLRPLVAKTTFSLNQHSARKKKLIIFIRALYYARLHNFISPPMVMSYRCNASTRKLFNISQLRFETKREKINRTRHPHTHDTMPSTKVVDVNNLQNKCPTYAVPESRTLYAARVKQRENFANIQNDYRAPRAALETDLTYIRRVQC